jgi:Xaa-Pro dipeptidase
MQPAMYAEQRVRLAKELLGQGADHCAVFQGGAEVPVNSSDTAYLFRQESYYEYLFGYSTPDCFGAVFANGHSVVFIPRLPASYAVWMGKLPTCESIRALLQVDEVKYVDELAATLASHNVASVHVMSGVNSDSGLHVLRAFFDGIENFNVIDTFLYRALSTQRLVKTDLEKEVLKYVCRVSSNAHIHVMQSCKPGMSQHQLESLFLHHVYFYGGCRRVSYTCICATGHHGAVLHYPNNDAPVEDGGMALLDMGGEYRCYASDITCSFPVNGKFTDNQRTIYNAVLEAHDAVLRKLKAGTNWVDMHRLALRIMCGRLLEAGILQNATVDELMAHQIMRLFQPHGMGHLIGLDVHDVGGYLDNSPPRPEAADCCKLRTARDLEAGYYVTVEPGCYFNHALLAAAFEDDAIKAFLNEALIRSTFWNFGGVRIESDVLITEDGAINYTVVPRTVEEIEATMSGQAFQGAVVTHKNVE